jgi:hypothetical protein
MIVAMMKSPADTACEKRLTCMREEADLHIPAREEAYLHDVKKKKDM